MNTPTPARPSLPQRILENLNTAVLLFDRELNLAYINPAGEMLLAISARRLLQRPASELFPLAPELVQLLREALASGQPLTRRELGMRLAPDRELTVDLVLGPISDGRRRSELIVELVQLDRQLRISREEQLLQQQGATRELLRGLAHEVKNPLGGLRGAAQLLERELADAALKEYTRVIIGEADRLQKLVDRVLGPSQRPHKSTLNLHEVLERVRQLVRAAGAGARIRRDYDPSIPALKADRDLLVQAVLNIVLNAQQAGSGLVTLRTRILRQFTLGNRRYRLVAELAIIDDGPGVAPELRECIFYPMVSGRPDGTGLGLSIAQSIVRQHGGLIRCESRPGRTAFTLLLPITDGANHDEHA